MQENPFIKLLEIMHNESARNNPTTYKLGTVSIEQLENVNIPLIGIDGFTKEKRSDFNSIKVTMDGITLDRDDLLINKDIKYIENNEKVLLIPTTDNQKYFLVCRLG